MPHRRGAADRLTGVAVAARAAGRASRTEQRRCAVCSRRPPVDVATLIQPQSPWSFALGSFDSFWMPVSRERIRACTPSWRAARGEGRGLRRRLSPSSARGRNWSASSSTLFGAHLKPGAQQRCGLRLGDFQGIRGARSAGHAFADLVSLRDRRPPVLTGLPSQLWYGFRATAGTPSAALVAARVECGRRLQRRPHTLRALGQQQDPALVRRSRSCPKRGVTYVLARPRYGRAAAL